MHPLAYAFTSRVPLLSDFVFLQVVPMHRWHRPTAPPVCQRHVSDRQTIESSRLYFQSALVAFVSFEHP